MSIRPLRACLAALLASTLLLSAIGPGTAEDAKPASAEAGVIALRSRYGVEETVARLKADIAAKGITFFQEIDQSALAARSGVELRPSVLLVFGNPPLGAQFMTANPQAGLDWPVRMLVYRDDAGTVWVAYTEFAWIARRHGVTSRDAQFRKAAEVAASIGDSVSGR
ncbi:MAG: DUF302 domain-containing protein [Pseudomonadota bacterium]